MLPCSNATYEALVVVALDGRSSPPAEERLVGQRGGAAVLEPFARDQAAARPQSVRAAPAHARLRRRARLRRHRRRAARERGFVGPERPVGTLARPLGDVAGPLARRAVRRCRAQRGNYAECWTTRCRLRVVLPSICWTYWPDLGVHRRSNGSPGRSALGSSGGAGCRHVIAVKRRP